MYFKFTNVTLLTVGRQNQPVPYLLCSKRRFFIWKEMI